MGDYAKQTWVDDTGDGASGTVFTATRMNNIEEGIRVAGKRSIFDADAAAFEDKEIQWKHGAGGAVIAYIGEPTFSGTAPNRNFAQEDLIAGEGTGYARRFIRAQQSGGGRASLQITANGAAAAGGRELRAIAESADGLTNRQAVILNDTGDSDFLQVAGSAGTGQKRLSQDVTAASSVTFSGLAGDTDRAYRVLVAGRLLQSQDRNVYVLLRGTDNSDNARNVGQEWYYNDDGTRTGTAPAAFPLDSGLYVANARWTLPCDITSDAMIHCHSGSNPTHHFVSSCKPVTTGPRIMHQTGSGMLYTPRTVTSLIVSFGGGTFTGRVTLIPMRY